MSDMSGGSPIQFDTAMPRGGAASETAALVCKGCHRPITSTYYDVSGESMCAECRTKMGAIMETPTGAGPVVKAGLFGIGAGIAGAIVYYGVIAITKWEIGIVAILIGYMVGYAVRAGAGGGGRRFQVMAIALTYFAIALAYTPILFKAALAENRKEAAAHATADGTGTDSGDASVTAAVEKSEAKPSGSPLLAVALLLGLIVALPVLSIIGSMPSGLISALIIFFGMKQAWRMTGTPGLVITGPYRVGAPRATSA